MDQKNTKVIPGRVFSDLSACFKYPINDNQSIVSDTAELKKRPADKNFSTDSYLNLHKNPLKSKFEYKDHSNHNDTRFGRETTKSEDTDVPSSLLSNAIDFKKSVDITKRAQVLVKADFFCIENNQFSNQIRVETKDVIENPEKVDQCWHKASSMKIINLKYPDPSEKPRKCTFKDRLLMRNLNLFRKGIYKFKTKYRGQLGQSMVPVVPVSLKPEKCCSCKSSKCLKLYCECFKSKGFCSSLCKCLDCKNRISEDLGSQKSAINSSLKNPNEPICLTQKGEPSQFGQNQSKATPFLPLQVFRDTDFASTRPQCSDSECLKAFCFDCKYI
jgi:hypothetical protein